MTPTRRALFATTFALAGATAGCATTTWTLVAGECIGPEVDADEYQAYALFLRELNLDAPIAIPRHTLTETPISESELADLPEKGRQKFREFEKERELRPFADAGPEWTQAVADYNERNAGGWGCLDHLPRRSSGLACATSAQQTVTFSRVGFDAAKKVAIFKVELSGSTGRCAEGLIVRLVKTPGEGWIVLQHQDWIASR